jgi:ubiquinol-cytochrome c reductase cytochrome c subunit
VNTFSHRKNMFADPRRDGTRSALFAGALFSRRAIRYVVFFVVAALLLCARQPAHAQSAQKSAKAESPANVENGKRLYVNYGCYECHGREGQGSPYSGARLAPRPVDLGAFIVYVRQPAGQMPPYTAKVVSDADLADIRAFLNALPQPPATRSIPLLN